MKIGVDGGGTTTRAVLIDENTRVLGRGEAGSSNHYGAGLTRAIENIESAVEAALQSNGARGDNVTFWGLGLAGACTSTEQQTIREALETVRKRLAPAAKIAVDEDAAAALAGAFAPVEGEKVSATQVFGAVCIAGTGANCFGIGADGKRARADGLGPLLGDRGSGYWIGARALQAACSAADGSGAPTRVLASALQHLGVGSVNELVQIAYKPDFTPSFIASLFPVVCDCAAASDEVAVGILRSAGEQLARTALCVLEPLNITRLAVTGGVLSTRDTPVRAAFEVALHARDTTIEIREPQRDAAVGAALLHD